MHWLLRRQPDYQYPRRSAPMLPCSTDCKLADLSWLAGDTCTIQETRCCPLAPTSNVELVAETRWCPSWCIVAGSGHHKQQPYALRHSHKAHCLAACARPDQALRAGCPLNGKRTIAVTATHPAVCHVTLVTTTYASSLFVAWPVGLSELAAVRVAASLQGKVSHTDTPTGPVRTGCKLPSGISACSCCWKTENMPAMKLRAGPARMVHR